MTSLRMGRHCLFKYQAVAVTANKKKSMMNAIHLNMVLFFFGFFAASIDLKVANNLLFYFD
jgi:hypothetical protein